MKKLIRFLKDEEGVTAIEYALIAALIFLGIVAAVTAFSIKLKATYTEVARVLP